MAPVEPTPPQVSTDAGEFDDDGGPKWRALLPYGLIIGFMVLIGIAILTFSVILTRKQSRVLAAQRAAAEARILPLLDLDSSRLHNFALTSPVKPFAVPDPAAVGGRGDAPGFPAYREEVCPVCLELFIDRAPVRDLPCQHTFHQACIDGWFRQRKYTCPMCKQAYFNPPEP